MKYKVDNIKLIGIEDECLVAGSVNIYKAKFEFDASWSEYTSLIAVFQHGNIVIEQLLVDNECEIPWEVLENPGYLYVGVRGLTSGKKRPTLWAQQKFVNAGTVPGSPSREPTPDKWQQVLATIEQAEHAVTPYISDNGNWFVGDKDTGVKARGDNGITPHIGDNGNWYIDDIDTGIKSKGDKGDPYELTEADKAEMVQAVLAALPNGDDVSY